MARNYVAVVDQLVESDNPIIRYKALVYLKDVKPSAKQAKMVRDEIGRSTIARTLIEDMQKGGHDTAYHTLKYLADIEYPPGDKSLTVYRDKVYAWLRKLEADYDGPLFIRDRYRCHGSFHGNALHWSILLGMANKETDDLCKNLLRYQWPGGGWNCKKLPKAKGPTIVHTAYGMRGLVTYQARKKSKEIASAIDACAEIMLERQVYLKRTNGKPLRPVYTKLSYPYARLYDFMIGLQILARAGYIDDPRCEKALDLLESKFIDGEGWPVERKTPEQTHSFWDRERLGKANLFLTVDALEILRKAGRL